MSEKFELLDACESGDVEFLRKYVAEHREKEDFTVVDEDGFGPLHYAVQSRSHECVEILLSTKLVDVGLKAACGANAFDSAIYWNVPCHTIRLLLENDPKFDLIPIDFGYLEPDVDFFTEIMEEIVDTLEKMRFPFANAFYFLNNITRNFHFWNDDEAARQIKIFDRLIGLVLDETADEFMDRVCEAIAACCDNYRIDEAESLMKWCIGKYHLSESNTHRDLVRKLLENPQFGFNVNVIFFLHSDIHDGLKCSNRFMRNIVECLLKVELKNRHVIDEVLDVLWPKANLAVIPKIYNFTFRERVFGKVSVEWLDVMRLGQQLDVGLIECFRLSDVRAILPLHMPFSTAITADVYLTSIRQRFEAKKIALEEQMGAYPSRREFSEERYSNAIESLERLDSDDELARFCVEGGYQVKCTLKSLCRAVIRRCLIRTNSKSHSELVRDIHSLELPQSLRKFSNSKTLPKSVQQFLLFNHSEYSL